MDTNPKNKRVWFPFSDVLHSTMMKGQQSLVMFVLLICLLFPTAVSAQDDEETQQFSLRARIAQFIEQLVTDDVTLPPEGEIPLDEDVIESAEKAPLDPTIVSGIIGGIAIAVAIMLTMRGYQQPRPRDPFRSRW